MNFGDLFDLALFDRMMHEGYVGVQFHPTRELLIYNYTHRAQYDRVWNEVTMQCRGLIIRPGGEVVCRPFPKFFNYGEHVQEIRELNEDGASFVSRLDLDARAAVWDKMDGSLGIVYPYPDGDGYAVATRGSFTSDQAIKATQILHDLYGDWSPRAGETVLLEIVYPENRIVLDYGAMEDLFLLEQIVNETGLPSEEFEDGHDWPGPSAKVFRYASLREALAAPPRPNSEGFVVHLKEQDLRVKIKQEDYVRLHRIVTGLNERTVWQHLVSGGGLDDLLTPLPDEFRKWAEGVAWNLAQLAGLHESEAREEYERIMHLPVRTSLHDLRGAKKEFASRVAESTFRVPGWLYMLYDGKDISKAVWASIKPAANAPREWTEDNA